MGAPTDFLPREREEGEGSLLPEVKGTQPVRRALPAERTRRLRSSPGPWEEERIPAGVMRLRRRQGVPESPGGVSSPQIPGRSPLAFGAPGVLGAI